MGEPRVSVVIPAHDRAWALPACLDSVLAQTLPPLEVLVVDDHSADDTAAVLARYAGRGVRHLRLAHGRGAQAARNLGIREARGEWIAFQDSDDQWLPRKLELQLQALQVAGGGENLVVHGDALIREGGHDRAWRLPLVEGDARAALLLQPGPVFPALLAPRRALLEAGGLDEACPAYQEWDTALRLAARCRFVHVRAPLFAWVRHGRGAISKDPTRAARGYAHVLARWRDDILAVHGPRGWRRQCLSAAVLAMRAGLWDEALAIVENESPHRSLALAGWLARRRRVPPGAGRALRALA